MEASATPQNIAKFSKAEDEFASKGGYAAESEARAIAAGLGLKSDRLSSQLSVLSGGERRRVELARILFAGSDTLLLDEPTNHLDIDAKTWLLGFLRDYRGALLVISHDLELLDEAITRVLHLDRAQEDSVGEIVEYRGTYTQYLSSRAADESRLAKKASLQEKEVARLQGVVDRFGAKASKAAMAHSIEKRIARIEETKVEGPSKDRQLKVRFPEPPAAGQTVITASGLRKTFGGPDIFHDVSFDLGRGERLLVLGLNGAGKTTLLRMLAGESKPDAPVRLGLTETQLRGMLGMFGLSGTKVFQESATLSGGEKTKLALAMLMVGRNNLLFLDEPTNNLDPPSRQAVADALSAWKGAIILVSHDTEFVEQLAPTKVLLMPDGQVDYFSNEWLDLVSLA
jgi:ATPase subunit of ABC transporter with duplicated ATPase domains